MQTELIHVGFDNHIALNRVLAVAAPGSAPVKRMVQRGKEERRAIDLTSGRRTKAVLVLDDDWVALIPIPPDLRGARLLAARAGAGGVSEPAARSDQSEEARESEPPPLLVVLSGRRASARTR